MSNFNRDTWPPKPKTFTILTLYRPAFGDPDIYYVSACVFVASLSPLESKPYEGRLFFF